MAILALATQHSLSGSQDQRIGWQDLHSLQELGSHPVLTVSASLCHLAGIVPLTLSKALIRAPAMWRGYFRGLETVVTLTCSSFWLQWPLCHRCC